MKVKAFLFLFLCHCLQPLAAETQWDPEALMQLEQPTSLALSPDGQEVVYALTKSILKEGESCYQTHLYKGSVAQEYEPYQLTFGEESCVAPQWSPDGKWLAFLSSRGGLRSIYLMRMSGGEARPLAKIKSNVTAFVWSPDGTELAFVAPAPGGDAKAQAYVYGEQYQPDHLWKIGLDSDSEPEQLTSGFHVRSQGDFSTINHEISWSPDGSQIAFAYSDSSALDSMWLSSRVAVLDLKTKSLTQVPPQSTHDSTPRFSPDGHWIAFLKGDDQINYYVNRKVCLYSLSKQQVRELSSSPNQGVFLVGPTLIGWTGDSRHVLLFEPQRLRRELLALPLDGREAEIVNVDSRRLIKTLAQGSSLAHIAYVGESLYEPPEVFVTTVDSSRNSTQLTRHNIAIAKKKAPKSQIIHWQGPQETEIEGILTYPMDYKRGTKVPLVLVVHGGPMGAFSESFVGQPYPYPFASFAEEGFAVLRCNPRGSTGYGRAFREANFADWGGLDLQDLLKGIDKVVEMGVADPERLGICGWSYGGYMTAWAITQTERFKVASVGAGLSNLVSMAGTTDLEHFLEAYFGGAITEKPELYRERSPLTHVSKVVTPCLIQHPENDTRVPLGQGLEFYQALKRADKPTQLVLYPRQNHHFHEPHMELDVMQRNLAWFKEYLKPAPAA